MPEEPEKSRISAFYSVFFVVGRMIFCVWAVSWEFLVKMADFSIFAGFWVLFCVFLNYDSGSDVQLYELGSYKCIPNYSYGPCIRTRGIIHYVISGSGILQIGGHEYPVHADQLFYIPIFF